MNAHRALCVALLVISMGLALHLAFPQIPRIERSLRLISDTSHLLVGTASVAEVLCELCYAELLGRSVKTVSGPGYSSRLKRCRGIERWFMLRLDRKSTRLNSSHANISYAVFCLKKKKYQK